MGEMDDKIKDLLSNPEGLSQIMNMVRGLTGGGSESDSLPKPEPIQKNEPTANAASVSPPSFSALPDFSALAKLDPKIVSTAMRILSDFTNDDERIQLLYALKPHLRSERRDRVDKACQICRITKSIRSALNGFSGGSEHV